MISFISKIRVVSVVTKIAKHGFWVYFIALFLASILSNQAANHHLNNLKEVIKAKTSIIKVNIMQFCLGKFFGGSGKKR